MTTAVPTGNTYDKYSSKNPYARHYGARYMVVDWYTVVRLRPQLVALRHADEVAGLRLVHEVRAEGRTTRVFALEPAPPPAAAMGPPLGFVGDG